MIKSNLNDRGANPKNRQKGIATLLTVILMLFMLTLVAVYTTKVGIFEQMASANDARQKQAFHAAEAGINMVLERLRANLDNILSTETDGWFLNGGNNQRWIACPPTFADTHPCNAEKDATRLTNTYYYVQDAANPTVTAVSLGANVLPVEQTVEVGAILCPLDVNYSTDPPTINGCTSTPDTEMMITLVSRGTSDNGRGEAVVKQVFVDYDLAGGAPGVPLTAPFVGLPNGTADIVANPNGGGEGVPLSVWSAEALGINGALRTCEAYEFYKQYTLPEDISCPNCDCTLGEELSSKFTRYSDIRDEDPKFPPDLFEYFFGVPKAKYESVKSTMQAATAADCGNFDETTQGAYWVTGGCSIGGGGNNCSVGTQDNPVFLVISGDFKANGCEYFGMLFVTDAESPGTAMSVQMNGGATVFGAVMIDHNMKQSNGTLAIVYNADVLNRANKFNGIAAMPGGWSDFL